MDPPAESCAVPGADIPWYRRFTLRLWGVVGAILIGAIALHTFHTLDDQTEILERAARKQVLALAHALEGAGLPYLIENDLARLEELTQRLADQPGVLVVRVSDRGGRVLVHVERDAEGHLQLRYDSERLDPGAATVGTRKVDAGAALEVWKAMGAPTLGWLQARYSLAAVQLARQHVIRDTVLALVGSLFGGFVLLALYLHKPLTALKNATRFAARLHERHGDTLPPMHCGVAEIGQLRRALNHASHELTDSHQKLSQTSDRLRTVLDHAADAFVTLTPDGAIESVNAAAGRLSGRPESELIGQHFATAGLIAQRSLPRAREEFRCTLEGAERPPFELEMLHRDGQRLPVEVVARLVRQDGTPTGVQVTVRNLSEHKRLEQVAARLGRIVERSPLEFYVFDTDNLRFVQVSESAQSNLGFSAYELSAMTPLDIEPEYTPEQFHAVIAPLRGGGGETDEVRFETVHQRKNGTHYPVEVRLQLSHAEQPPVFLAIAQDLTRQQTTESRLRFLANYDPLTRLANRDELVQRLNQTLVEAKRHDRLVGVMSLNLDHFRHVNDTLGHAAGDHLLKQVAHVLEQAVRFGDTVARTGGDEFAVVLANVAHVDDIARIGDKILEQLAQPVQIEGHEFLITSGIGITVYPFDEQDADGLLKNANIALRHAKEQGRNNYRFYTAELNTRIQRRHLLEQHLRQALAHGELQLHYQPQLDLATGHILGCEALLRWQHPELGTVSPAEFIPVAEDSGLILPIGEWVLETACRDACAWHAAGYPDTKVAVNLSVRQFEDGRLPETVARVLAQTGLSATQLDLEITENLLLKDMDGALKLLQTLHAMGVTLSLDDFGTGYSSLSYLRQLPIDQLKIDRSFLCDITDRPEAAALVGGTIRLAHALNLKVVAEGVETAGQWELLREKRCNMLQGYHIGRPMPAADFHAWMRARARPQAN